MFSTPPLKPHQILSTEYNYILCKPCAVYHIYLNQFDQKHSQNLSPLTKHLLGIKTNHPSYLNFASSIQPYIVHLFCFGHAYKIKIIHTTKQFLPIHNYTNGNERKYHDHHFLSTLLLIFNSLFTSFYIHTAFLQNCTSLHVCNVLNHYVQNFYSFAFKTEKKINKKTYNVNVHNHHFYWLSVL